MAKAQTFADKVKKKTAAQAARVIKLVYPYQSPDTGAWRFVEKFVKVKSDEDENAIVKAEIENGKALLEKH
jgi:hypothetical protein